MTEKIPYNSCWKFDPDEPSGQKWDFIENDEDYVEKVIKEYEK